MKNLKKAVDKFMDHNPHHDVQNRELLDFGIGVAGQNMSYCLISSWFEYFCNIVLLIKPLYTGLFLGIMRGWDAINDPMAGSIIDRVHLKSGEKLRPYIRVVSLPLGLLTMLMFVNFGFQSQAAKIAYVVAMYFLWDTLYSFHDIAQWGMVARISNMPERRDAAAYAARLGGTVGSWIPASLTVVLGLVLDGFIPITVTQVFIIYGLLMGLGGMSISMVQLRCRERTPVSPSDGSILEGFKLLKHNRIAICLVIANLASNITLVLNMTYFFQFMVVFKIGGLELNGLNFLTVFGIVTAIPGAIAMLFTPKLAKKVGGMKRILFISTFSTIIFRTLVYLIGYEGWRMIFMVLFFTIIAIPQNMTSIAGTSLWCDGVDYTEWKTGKRNEGTAFALQNFVAKASSSLSVIFSGITLTILNFNPEAMEAGAALSPEFIKYSWPVYCLGPVLGALLYLIPLSMIKYTNRDREVVQMDIAERRAQSEGWFVQDAWYAKKLLDDEGYDIDEFLTNLAES